MILLMSTTAPLLKFAAALFASAVVLSGCQTMPSDIPAPPAPMQLLDAAPLAIDSGCEVEGAVLVEYTVLRSGRTGNIEVSSAPDCARDALSAWVSSYRYTPQRADTSTRFEWMLVSARRGS